MSIGLWFNIGAENEKVEFFRLLQPFRVGFILLKEPAVASVEGGEGVGSFNL